MILVSQPFSRTALYHLLFDTLMVRSICLAFENETIVLVTDAVTAPRICQALEPRPPNLDIRIAGQPECGARRLALRRNLLHNLKLSIHVAEQTNPRAAVFLAFETATCWIATRKPPKVPCIFVVHNNFQRLARTPLGPTVLRQISRSVAALIFLDPTIADQACASGAVEPRKAVVVPHPVDASQVQATFGSPRRGVVFAGRLFRGKGLRTLLHAARMLKTGNPSVLQRLPIRIVGDFVSGDNPAAYSDCVEYAPAKLPDEVLDRELRNSLYAVFPYEPSAYAHVTPGSLYRAIGCGVPVIATELPSTAFLNNGESRVGYLFNDAHSLATLLTSLAGQSPHEYRTLLDGVAQFASARSIEATARVLRRALPIPEFATPPSHVSPHANS